jgi:tetratricopeptide (TPR) repeat protein
MTLFPKPLLAAIIATHVGLAYAQTLESEFKKVLQVYTQGKYQATVDQLNLIEQKLLGPKEASKKTLGLIEYWKGMCHNRLQNFPNAIKSFEVALKSGHDSKDINYEYGQALFASDKLERAREQFYEAFKKGAKRGTSLYYMAFISKELGDNENAKTLYEQIIRLPGEESKDSSQAAKFQLADLELEEAEKSPNAFQAIEKNVIPAYKRALKESPESAIATKIKEKIVTLQRKYELILFQLQNGRPTAIPPYYLRLAEEIGNDTNVTFAPTETTISKARQGSLFSKTEVMGRHTFYYKNFLSVAPELRMNYSRYFNRVPEIYRNDNYLIAPALRGTYEHSLFNKPASVLLEYDHNYAGRDVQAEKQLDFSSRANSFTFGERFNFFEAGQTSVRLRYRLFESYLSVSDSKTISLVFDQLISIKRGTIMIYSSFDRTRVNNEDFDSDAMTLRTDWILPKYKEVTPSVGMGLTITDPINDRGNRGIEKMLNPNARLSRRFGSNWGTSFRAEYMRNFSKDESSFAYKKTLYALEMEYLF